MHAASMAATLLYNYLPHLKPNHFSSVVIRITEYIAYMSVFWLVKPIDLVN